MKTKYAFNVYVDGEFEQYGPFYGKDELRKGILKFYKGFCFTFLNVNKRGGQNEENKNQRPYA